MVLHEFYSVSMSHSLIGKPYNFCTLKWRRRINKSGLAFLRCTEDVLCGCEDLQYF